METREAFQLLTLASARDGRTVDAAVAAVWADDLSDVALSDAVAAARAHYRETSDWLMPSHIRTGIARIKRQREIEESRRRAMRPIEPARNTFPGREAWDAMVATAIRKESGGDA